MPHEEVLCGAFFEAPQRTEKIKIFSVLKRSANKRKKNREIDCERLDHFEGLYSKEVRISPLMMSLWKGLTVCKGIGFQ